MLLWSVQGEDMAPLEYLFWFFSLILMTWLNKVNDKDKIDRILHNQSSKEILCNYQENIIILRKKLESTLYLHTLMETAIPLYVFKNWKCSNQNSKYTIFIIYRFLYELKLINYMIDGMILVREKESIIY